MGEGYPPGLGPDKAPRPSPHNARGHGNSLTNENERKSSGPTIRGGSSRRARCARNGPKIANPPNLPPRRTAPRRGRGHGIALEPDGAPFRRLRAHRPRREASTSGGRSIHGAATCSARGRKTPRTFPRVTRPRLVSMVGLVFHVFPRAPKTKRGTKRTEAPRTTSAEGEGARNRRSPA